MMSNKTYDILKELALVWIPAFATLIFTLSEIWGWSWGENVVYTIVAIDTFLGAVCHISNINYKRGME